MKRSSTIAVDMDAPLLDVTDYRVGFKTERGLAQAVDGVSFTLDAGETLGIVGESGSGKSVLNRSIMGLISGAKQIESGSVKYRGVEIANTDRQNFWGSRIAMIFQDPMTSLNPVMRVGKQIFEPLKQHLGMDRGQARERAIELLTSVGIPSPEKRLRQYPHELSGGMRQRVMIAIALAAEPELLIADEPTTALDVTVQKYILDLLRELQLDRGMGMVLITHDLGVARGRTDQVLVMYGGRVMEHAPTDDLFSEMRHPYTDALLASIPRISHAKHTRLTPIDGSPPDIIAPPPGCRFSPRCRSARQECVDETPPMTATQTNEAADHRYACHFPVGTPKGIEAREQNEADGQTVTGLRITPRAEVAN